MDIIELGFVVMHIIGIVVTISLSAYFLHTYIDKKHSASLVWSFAFFLYSIRNIVEIAIRWTIYDSERVILFLFQIILVISMALFFLWDITISIL